VRGSEGVKRGKREDRAIRWSRARESNAWKRRRERAGDRKRVWMNGGGVAGGSGGGGF